MQGLYCKLAGRLSRTGRVSNVSGGSRVGHADLKGRGLLWTLVLVAFVLRGVVWSADPVSYTLCDVRVLYVFDDPKTIDWPTLYYLNDNYGCRIDLLSLQQRASFASYEREIPKRQIYLYRFYLPDYTSNWFDSTAAHLFERRRPDIVIIGDPSGDWLNEFKNYLTSLSAKDSLVFNVARIYAFDTTVSRYQSEGSSNIVLHSRELMERYRNRIDIEVPQLFDWYASQEFSRTQLVRYRPVQGGAGGQPLVEADFLSGIERFRLVDVIEEGLPDGPMKTTFLTQAGKFVSLFRSSQRVVEGERVNSILSGYRELSNLRQHRTAGTGLGKYSDFSGYLEDVMALAESAALDAAGVDWEGRIILRDSPHGARVKFRATLAVTGSEKVTLTGVQFHPYWDSVSQALDTVPHEVAPHQTFVREYLVEVDAAHLESEQPESLLVTAGITYGGIPLEVSTALSLREEPDLDIAFEPEFFFVQPFAKLDADRVVSSLNWKVIITKPINYADTVDISLETPRGIFAGAYKTKYELDKGSSLEIMRIPFTVSNLFELGIHNPTISLAVDGKIISADTGRMRIAACHISDKIKIGFLADRDGRLEDILRMTDAAFQPMTDRSLVTGDLDAYNVIVIGSEALADYPSFAIIKERVEDYLRYGGSLVIMPQGQRWPQGVLPVSLAPSLEQVAQGDITIRIPDARILTEPYKIATRGLLSSFFKRREVRAAAIAPAEKVLTTPRSGALLSVSRLGKGQIIYCGLPLLEMIARLDIDAIHLFANILNY